MLNGIMLTVIAKHKTLSVVMQNAVMLIDTIEPIILSIVILSVTIKPKILSVIIQNVAMPSVVAPFSVAKNTKKFKKLLHLFQFLAYFQSLLHRSFTGEI
jgi:hypothetical protein